MRRGIDCYWHLVGEFHRDRHSVPRNTDRLLRCLGGACLRVRTLAEAVMSWLYVLSGFVALAITIYLVVALLYPEKF